MIERTQWMTCVANLLGERTMPKDWEDRVAPLYERGIRAAYAAAKLREWLGASVKGETPRG